MNQKLSDWASIAEIVSAVAVVGGLIFVGLQIRQSAQETALNTSAVEVAAYQDLISQVLDINLAVMSDPELVDIIVRGQDAEFTSDNEAQRYQRFAASLVRHADMAGYQYERGIIGEERLAAMWTFVVNQMNFQPSRVSETSTPGLTACYERVSDLLE